VLLGRGAVISTLDYARLVVPLKGESGLITIHLALREGADKTFNTGKTPIAKSQF
jgi:hypothetical protein